MVNEQLEIGLEEDVEDFQKPLGSLLNNRHRSYSKSSLEEYTKSVLKYYDSERHIPLEEACSLVKSEPHLNYQNFESALSAGKIHKYSFDGQEFVDRLDIGRIFHQDSPLKKGIAIERYFSDGKINPLDSVEYKKRDLKITDANGNVIWELNDAMFPESFDQVSANIIGEKYFFAPEKTEWKEKIRSKIGMERETSLKNLISRVSDFFAEEGFRLGYFTTEEDKQAFRDELAALQIQRKFAFNSPVYFNAGIYTAYGIEGNNGNYWRDSETDRVIKLKEKEYVHPQCHACFIVGPRDDLESIAEQGVSEMAIFSSGSGVGQDIGALRAEGEKLSSGGEASGPLRFLKVYDRIGGTIKSGGRSRRAARMSVMSQYHPDIMKFVESKLKEDLKALTLMRAGYEPGMDGEAYTTVSLQNTNISVRLNDHFFEQVEKDGEIDLRNIKNEKIVGKVRARTLLQKISHGSWMVGDPGVQYDSIIQKMHTCKNSGKQKATNPCGEYAFINDTACNLGSLNLLEFADELGNIDLNSLKKGIKIGAIALDIANDAASYPVKEVAEISPEFRTIGLGYTNLGALIMRKGFAYDSKEGRALTGALTAILTANAYETSARLAENLGTFKHFEFNENKMLEVIKEHKKNLESVSWEKVPELKEEAFRSWSYALTNGEKFGYRNAQATVIAPTGTISYLMGCDTLGIEPSISLMIGKDLAGGGRITLVNKEVPNALKNLGYSKEQIEDIKSYLLIEKTIHGAPHITPDHYPVFHTSFGDKEGKGSISLEGHIRMVAAAQPFVSGAISKTLNVPEQATVKDVYNAFILGHKLELKGATIFRNNSKPVSAMNFGEKSYVALKRGEKEDLPEEIDGRRVKINFGGEKIYLFIGEYPDGRVGEIFFEGYKQGSTLGALLATAGILASRAIKRGVNLEDVLDPWLGHKFEPEGHVKHPHIKLASSPLDFAARWILLNYKGDISMAQDTTNLKVEELRGWKNGAMRTYQRMHIDPWKFEDVINDSEFGGFVEKKNSHLPPVKINSSNSNKNGNKNGKTCPSCGRIMFQTSSNCYSCTNCGDKVGGCGA